MNTIASNPVQQLHFSSKRSLPVVLQTEAAECGLACLAMIAGYHGYTTDLTSLRRRFSLSTHGVNLKQLMDMATRLHLVGRALQLDMEDLPQLQLPCVIHWDMSHFVVLKSVTKNKIVIHDPAVGERAYRENEFAEHFTGVALELQPTDDFEIKEEKQTLKLGQFWSKVVGLKRSLIQILLLSFILQMFAIASPFYLQTIVDDVLLRSDTQLLLVLAVGFCLLMLVRVGTETLRSLIVLHLSSKLSIQMAANLFRHLIRLPLDYFEKRHMGDIVSRFGSLNEIKNLLSTGIVAVLVDGVMAIMTLAMMAYYDLTLTAVVVVVVFLYALLRYALYKPLRQLTEASIVSHAKEHSNFMETLRAMQSVKIFQRENDRQNLWQNRYAEAMNTDIRIGKWKIGFNTLNSLLFGIENIVVIYLAADAVMGNMISLGMLYAFMSYKDQFVNRMGSLITKWIEFRMLGLHLERLSDIAFTKAEQTPSTLPQPDAAISGALTIENLSFRYSEAEPFTFENLSFDIQAGESVAIVGPSGCGKTTLVKCLMGLFQPHSGKVLVDGTPLEQLESYRGQIAAVMQDDQLISGSIADNIAFFEPQIDLDWVVECAKIAAIHDDILKMPMNYNTLIGDMGTSLSGGQKQRILLARALYRKPKILFLDEATSHLDIENENLVSNNIKELNTTRVIIAHRTETIASADRLINLYNINRTGHLYKANKT
nr:peptidase domain-containing ABC transporter [uncultured Vibrio sp.]